jgi:hypothetical protein
MRLTRLNKLNKLMIFMVLNYKQYHHFFIGVSFVLIAGGMKRIVQRHSMTGTSLVTAGIVHNSTGGLGLAIFAFLSLFGGYRPMSRGLRTVFIALHWTFGWLVYVLACEKDISFGNIKNLK